MYAKLICRRLITFQHWAGGVIPVGGAMVNGKRPPWRPSWHKGKP
jgi:hypothetical protein